MTSFQVGELVTKMLPVSVVVDDDQNFRVNGRRGAAFLSSKRRARFEGSGQVHFHQSWQKIKISRHSTELDEHHSIVFIAEAVNWQNTAVVHGSMPVEQATPAAFYLNDLLPFERHYFPAF